MVFDLADLPSAGVDRLDTLLHALSPVRHDETEASAMWAQSSTEFAGRFAGVG